MARLMADIVKMKQKNKILLFILGIAFLSAIVLWILGHSPILAIVLGLVAFFMIYVLWDLPPKHKEFSYKDQQRGWRAFDRSDMIDLGKPDWAKDKKKRKK
jgi:4-hydroxybenzoate polyprenyltransferase